MQTITITHYSFLMILLVCQQTDPSEYNFPRACVGRTLQLSTELITICIAHIFFKIDHMLF